MAEAPKTSTIREKFGIDYLISKNRGSEGGSSTSGSLANPVVERGLAAYGSRILSMLLENPERSGRLHDVVDRTGLNMETLLGIVDRMVRSGLIEMVEPDKYGNHKIRITPAGEELSRQ